MVASVKEMELWSPAQSTRGDHEAAPALHPDVVALREACAHLIGVARYGLYREQPPRILLNDVGPELLAWIQVQPGVRRSHRDAWTTEDATMTRVPATTWWSVEVLGVLVEAAQHEWSTP